MLLARFVLALKLFRLRLETFHSSFQLSLGKPPVVLIHQLSLRLVAIGAVNPLLFIERTVRFLFLFLDCVVGGLLDA